MSEKAPLKLLSTQRIWYPLTLEVYSLRVKWTYVGQFHESTIVSFIQLPPKMYSIQVMQFNTKNFLVQIKKVLIWQERYWSLPISFDIKLNIMICVKFFFKYLTCNVTTRFWLLINYWFSSTMEPPIFPLNGAIMFAFWVNVIFSRIKLFIT